ncbi:PREDICTED: uncharacterized protein LOC108370557 [Rhagoletis zephyria]|uniref:uncharacterized protein LOC108370557 n=1 Tax=Rhagoletis zephyria TaxID=28612 RepID=UPI00081183DC|nr:PREDICTED: uncharacterized protein LOC108370557 [Rhagoletis zephyria]XP_017481381.1 PREDICTED: uncharacterized protein LOC108370557 [Rhagoletis zephyria]XP_036329266.1 uncharacterized protein LOC118741405 [Rhagoletis pomonella]
MVSAVKSLLAIAVIASVACSAFAVQCYLCDSATEPKCGVKFEASDSMKFDCARVSPPRFLQNFFNVHNATGCMKKVLDVPGHPQIIRACYFGDVSNTQSGCQSDPSLPFVKQLSCDVCTGNLCNGSSATAPIAAAIVLFFAMARMLS